MVASYASISVSIEARLAALGDEHGVWQGKSTFRGGVHCEVQWLWPPAVDFRAGLIIYINGTKFSVSIEARLAALGDEIGVWQGRVRVSVKGVISVSVPTFQGGVHCEVHGYGPQL